VVLSREDFPTVNVEIEALTDARALKQAARLQNRAGYGWRVAVFRGSSQEAFATRRPPSRTWWSHAGGRLVLWAGLVLAGCGAPVAPVDAAMPLPDGELRHCADAPETGWCPAPLECVRGHCGRFCNADNPCPNGERCAPGEDYCTPSE
jgi:hypothetical protein